MALHFRDFVTYYINSVLSGEDVYESALQEAYDTLLEQDDAYTITEEELNESIAGNQAKRLGVQYLGFGYYGSKGKDGHGQASHHVVNGKLDVLAEGGVTIPHASKAGSLSDLPAPWKKHLTKNSYAANGTFGDRSNIEHVSTPTSTSGYHGLEHNELTKGHHVMIKVDGHPETLLHPAGTYGREKYKVHTTEGQQSKERREFIRGKWVGGAKNSRRTPDRVREFKTTDHAKGELNAVMAATASNNEVDKDGLKAGRITIHRISTDKERGAELTRRQKAGGGDSGADYKLPAARKFDDKKMGQRRDSSAETKAAMDAHAKVGAMLAAGQRVPMEHLEAMNKAMFAHNSSVSNRTYDDRDREDLAKDLSSSSKWNKEYALKNLKRKLSK